MVACLYRFFSQIIDITEKLEARNTILRDPIIFWEGSWNLNTIRFERHWTSVHHSLILFIRLNASGMFHHLLLGAPIFSGNETTRCSFKRQKTPCKFPSRWFCHAHGRFSYANGRHRHQAMIEFYHQKFQVPKLEVMKLIRLFGGVGFPLHKPYLYNLYKWVPNFWYLKCLSNLCGVLLKLTPILLDIHTSTSSRWDRDMYALCFFQHDSSCNFNCNKYLVLSSCEEDRAS